jgi:hypothetical protein
MDLKAVERAVSRIQVALFKKSNSFAAGILRSNFKGTGLQFKEHQVYCYGDDVRFIDWKMVAKTSHPYIKTFEEERNVEITVVLDISPTMLLGYRGVSKLQAAIEITCLLYLLAKQSGDYIRVLLIGDTVQTLPKLAGRVGISALLLALDKQGIMTADGKINIKFQRKKVVDEKEKMSNIFEHLYRHRELIFLSDFNDFIDLETHKKIFYRQNVTAFQIISPLDEVNSIPFSCLWGDPLQGACWGKVNLDEQKREMLSGYRIKKLKVEEDYLENFIKAMMKK